MASLTDLQSEIEEALRINSDDSEVDRRLITRLIAEQRALWIRNEYNKNRSISEDVTQDLGCIAMELKDAADCCSDIVEAGCKVLRTAVDLPKPIEYHNSSGFTRVGATNTIKAPISLIPYQRVPFAGNGRFNQGRIFAFYLNNRMYLYSKTEDFMQIEYLNIRGVFEDPTAAGSFRTCSDLVCWTPDSEYPINDWMWTYMKEQIIQQLLRQESIPMDEDNDAKQRDVVSQPKIQ